MVGVEVRGVDGDVVADERQAFLLVAAVDESLPGYSRTSLGVFVVLIFLDIWFHPVFPGEGIGGKIAVQGKKFVHVFSVDGGLCVHPMLGDLVAVAVDEARTVVCSLDAQSEDVARKGIVKFFRVQV